MTVVIQGQGQTTGQLQLIPQGVTVLPGPGQQLMQAAMPNGTVQRFLFTPLATTAATTSSTTTTVSTTAAGRTWELSGGLLVGVTSCRVTKEARGRGLYLGRMCPKPMSVHSRLVSLTRARPDLLPGQTPCRHPSTPLGNEESRGWRTVVTCRGDCFPSCSAPDL